MSMQCWPMKRWSRLFTRHWCSAIPKAAGAADWVSLREVVLRLLVLKHIRNWSYAVLEREVRANLVYRDFTRVGAAKMPDAKTIGRWGVAHGANRDPSDPRSDRANRAIPRRRAGT